ncbi:cupin-like domain-containing protein [Altererythrobacter sp. ZODW24]|uniref:cupin-like domain-containing protein n=1 Tax=Altererythrobacter sp. ZODW24 TaxID=2185142 RepID=UPI000DF85F5D|nr:cupin-like domain-containing protein [Altererythrobacter sp. ZODW24]
MPVSTPVEECAAAGADWAAISSRSKPLVIRGLASAWPLVEAAKHGASEAVEYIAGLDSGAPTEVMMAAPDQGGRFFYRDDMNGFNFKRDKATLSQVGREIVRLSATDDAPALYAGATDTAQHLPGFDNDNPLELIASEPDAQSRVWLANKIEVATHFDLSDNIAVVGCGRRQFTLFPPQATGDLYVGPFNVTLAGQPVSMVNPLDPDARSYPRYPAAEELGVTALLEPGDAIFIPTLWWHHVAALDQVNVLVNYWYRNVQRGGPFLAFIHSLWAIRDLPDEQREGWRAWFDHFIFGPDAKTAADHLPSHAQGVNGPASPQRDEAIRRFIMQVLSEG